MIPAFNVSHHRSKERPQKNKTFIESVFEYYLFKQQPHKIVKHTETIRRQQPTNRLIAFDHFGGLALNRDIFRSF